MHISVLNDQKCACKEREKEVAKTHIADPIGCETADDDHARCKALGQVLDRIGDKWTIGVVGALSKGPIRFNSLLRLIGGVSHRMLTLTLRGLEQDGLVKRTVYPTVPPKVEYELTEMGGSLIGPLEALSLWAQEHRPAIEAARAFSAAHQKQGAAPARPVVQPALRSTLALSA
ncbi:winged helix-turn-helix transcriptional regulator [Duganella radicis]|uniref:Transcriptional regulator n=1 Tax=Duganella radicis TaxID=551988 RepID=A0A6L6PGT0_9BURK|nr:helix-turn-helix domain-containing protein [Duganella radicis]MTV37939.1 transcriptional regulator [Duganella radicis]